MHIHIFALILLLLIDLAVDLYIRRIVKKVGRLTRAIANWTPLLSPVLIGAIIVVFNQPTSHVLTTMWLIFVLVSIYVPKIVFVFFDLLGRIPQLFGRPRWRWWRRVSVTVAILLAIAMWWGALVNRFNIDVREVTVSSPHLKPAFDGYRVAQISDFHLGSFGSSHGFVDRVVSTINALDVDAVVFTGDIVNSQSGEMLPMVRSMRALTPRDGVFAVMGNHDYADYTRLDSVARIADRTNLLSLWRQAGVTVLNDSSVIVRRGDDSISVIGVQNIGRPPFASYGDLGKALNANDLSGSTYNILLTHNPEHWIDSIMDRPGLPIDLTLSGHTHAMQIRLLGWTPSSLRDKTPAGVYRDSLGHTLYVNIGLGTVGIPMRLGATPEVTVFTLRCK